MSLKSKIKKIFFKRGLLVDDFAELENILQFIERFKKHYISVDLIRVGGNNDGGYLLPDIFNDIKYCFSPGVDYTATFEKMISEKYGIKSFMIDASVESEPVKDKNFEFEKLYLGSYNTTNVITLKDWINNKLGTEEKNLLLQMDIESSEYNVLISESIETLKRFSCIIIEFHSTEKLFDKYFLRMMTGIFEKFYKEFSICHIHPNNLCGLETYNGIEIPRTFEVTFLRNDYVKKLKNDTPISLPHKLDQRNSNKCEDFVMPKIWWEK
ncbi:MAG: FkbM family methyltransferase [Halarcobacter sp.]